MKITMAQGSGGQASATLMNDVFGKYFHNPILSRLEDAAVFPLAGQVAYSTDSFVVTPLVFPCGDIGKLAVCGTVNDLLMMGARPRYLTTAFILEEGLPLADLETIVASLAETASSVGVEIVAGDTKVIEGRGGLLINTSGLGLIPEGRHLAADRAAPGDAVIVSGPLGDHHACILSARLQLANAIESDCAPLTPLVEALFAAGVEVKALRDITRGGLATVLNELAASSHCQITINETELPVRDEVRGFCDVLGLDPLYMGNEGKLVAIVSAADAATAVAALRGTTLGAQAVQVGAVATGQGVTMRTRLGGQRIIDMLYGEGLPRIC